MELGSCADVDQRVDEQLQELRSRIEVLELGRFATDLTSQWRLDVRYGALSDRAPTESGVSGESSDRELTCVVCGTASATKAHISKRKADVADTRHNIIRLCGSAGTVGTCHDKFDRHHIGLIHDGTSWWGFDLELNRVELRRQLRAEPRALAWRARRYLTRAALGSAVLPGFVATVLRMDNSCPARLSQLRLPGLPFV